MNRAALVLASTIATTLASGNPNATTFQFNGATFYEVRYDLSQSQFAPRVVFTGELQSFRTKIAGTNPITAITGTFFAWENELPVGDVVVDGDVVAEGRRGSALCVDWLGRVHIIDPVVRREQDWFPYRYALRATIRVLKNGRVAPNPRAQGFRDPRLWGSAARTCVAIGPNNTLYFFATSFGISLSTLGGAARSRGATDAVALDGGGSTMLFHRNQFLITTPRPFSTLFIVEERTPFDTAYQAHIGRLARNQTNGVAAGATKPKTPPQR